MKLEPKCVRAVLFALEETETINQYGFLENYSFKLLFESKHVRDYDASQIRYTLRMLQQAGYVSFEFLQKQSRTLSVNITAHDGLTYEGHQLLAAFRNDKIWKHVLGKVEQVGKIVPIPVLLQLAQEAIRAGLSG